ncbi:hypothetical protein ACA877_000480 [Vibrio alginolyticus]|nr:hypothetical protein [Vibrio alginolyticus]
MKLNIEMPGEFLPQNVAEEIKANIKKALNEITTVNNKFIINDSLYFRRQRTKKITPCVMNSATYISSQFQSNLDKIESCRGETKANGQAFDGYMEIPYEGKGYKIKKPNDLLYVIHEYIKINELPSKSIYTLFPMFYGMYVERGFYDINSLGFAEGMFDSVMVKHKFRVGVEFETGNVASSFRAINKLYTLFQSNIIDCGCFITSKDKGTCATRIWPVSNRNGSFQELEQRNYRDQVSLPLISIGFAPDGFDANAPFLSRKYGLYSPQDTGTLDESGKFKIFLGEDEEELLFPNH